MARGRIRTFDREKALTDAMLVFWRKGFNATSVRDLTEALGIGMPSLYATFGSKEELFVEAVTLYMKAAENQLWRTMEGLPARAAVDMLLRATANLLSDGALHPVGCMVAATLVDEDMPPSVAEAIRQARMDWIKVIQDRLERGVVEGDLPANADISGLSRFYAGIVQAVSVQAHDGASASVLNGIIDIAMAAWPQVVTQPKRKRTAGRHIASLAEAKQQNFP